ncbi:nitrogenase molybdenum-iron protein alpha chain [Cerasicoccus maritimus]|uniref:nitrogenase molybdenum-iron protein alpha chain n=1 Tax=Cerasicoccus maritimus TaxID=490089 RepID=UPI00285263F9|nr:nitrogenase molybdenum-iron protein alpha chain [Cerasicoccus maritimus]
MSEEATNDSPMGPHGPSAAEAREEMLKAYPKKTQRKRGKQMLVNEEPGTPAEIGANSRTVPGIITQRGCSYAGCKGVVIGPIYDVLHITHGPIGCGWYSWLSRRNMNKIRKPGETNFLQYSMSTDMQEDHIVFGGEKQLEAAIQEAYDEFKPKAISVYATCPVGLIGDDIHSVCRKMKEKLGINIFGFSCEGYKGVSQSAGHHIANNGVFKHMIGVDDTPVEHKYKINILGEYNIGGDAWEIDRVFALCGIKIIGTLSGGVSYDDITNCHMADLNVVMCHRSINYMAEMMEEKFGIPWFKVNFIGLEGTKKSLRKIAQYFGEKELIDRVEEVIAAEMAEVRPVVEDVKTRTTGKTAALFVGGSRAHHYQDLFEDMGMKVIAAGYEFAHRDDYEGRDVLPNIKIDADSRNIEELTVTPDETRFDAEKPVKKKSLEESGFEFSDYEGMMRQMAKDTLVIDDISHYEMEKLIELYKPDVIGSGIKDKYIVEKMGVPCKQLHSYDYGGPYAGFKGAINFFKDIDRMTSNKIWKLATPPWRNTGEATAEKAEAVTA